MGRTIKKTFLQLKAKYPDVILLIRCNDIYQSWDNDAELICKTIDSSKLQIKKSITSCSIQIHQTECVLNKLVKAGYKVALCDPL